MPVQPELKILVVQTAFIGDVILITPMLRGLRELYPDSWISVMVVPEAARLLDNNPWINEVISFAKKGKHAISLIKQLKLIKARHFDLVVSPHSSGRTHLLLYLARIPQRIGFDRGPAPFLLTARIKHPQNMHKINKNLALLGLLSPIKFSMQSELFPSDADFTMATALLAPLEGKQIIAIAPGSIWETKCWPVEYYTALVNKLIATGLGLVMIGGPKDKSKCDAIMEQISDQAGLAQIINLAGRTDLLQSAAVISRCVLMICNDSGALHIANAMGTRVFAFFGPTVPSIGYYPYRSGDMVFETRLDCRPCGSHGGNKCPLKHHRCMREILVDDVYGTVVDELKRH